VRGGRIKGSLSTCGRDLHRLVALKKQKVFSLAASHRQRKKASSPRTLRLCGEENILHLTQEN